jgi:hypothetical protein
MTHFVGQSHPPHKLGSVVALAAAVFAPPPAAAQQAVSPPQAQAWIDVATFSGLGAMGMPGAGGAGGVGGMLGGMLGGTQTQKNEFGHTRTAASGQWVDVTLMVRGQSLQDARQAVPAAFLASPLKLVSPQTRQSRPVPDDDDKTIEPDVERPKGRLLMYWGCGAKVRAGQPRVLDFASISPEDLQQFFATRSATQRGAHAVPGRPVWPNPDDSRMVPQGASLVGEHAFSGASVPEGFRFQIPAAQDLMPALELKQQEAGGATELRWNAIATARGYFLSAMGAKGENEAVFWTSSEVPDTGFGLIDYQTNPAVDRWVRDKVLLPPATTTCTVPQGVFGGDGAMLRAIAYGSELNLAHPPRPADPKVRWEPVWAVKVRVKSVTSAMLGMGDVGGANAGGTAPAAGQETDKPPPGSAMPKPIDVLRGILGR